MQYHGAPLKTSVTPLGILDLEFAGTVPEAGVVYTAWQPILALAVNNVLLDFFFIVCYTVFLYKAMLSLARLFNHGWRRLGIWASRGAIIAGSFDVVENILMLRTLHGHISKEIVASTFMFASIKFFLLGLAIIYSLLTPVAFRYKHVHTNAIPGDLH